MCPRFYQPLEILEKAGFYNPGEVVPYYVKEAIDFLAKHINKRNLLWDQSSGSNYNPIANYIDSRTRKIPFADTATASDVLKHSIMYQRKTLFPRVARDLKKASTDITPWIADFKSLSKLESDLVKEVLRFCVQIKNRGLHERVVEGIMPALLQYKRGKDTRPTNVQVAWVRSPENAVGFLFSKFTSNQI